MAFRWMDLSDWLSYRYSIIVKSQMVGNYCCKLVGHTQSSVVILVGDGILQ